MQEHTFTCKGKYSTETYICSNGMLYPLNKLTGLIGLSHICYCIRFNHHNRYSNQIDLSDLTFLQQTNLRAEFFHRIYGIKRISSLTWVLYLIRSSKQRQV